MSFTEQQLQQIAEIAAKTVVSALAQLNATGATAPAATVVTGTKGRKAAQATVPVVAKLAMKILKTGDLFVVDGVHETDRTKPNSNGTQYVSVVGTAEGKQVVVSNVNAKNWEGIIANERRGNGEPKGAWGMCNGRQVVLARA
jgi:hypothetical protein